jgi:hypothetical protein
MAKEIRLRQEVLNTILAELISTRGMEATPERVLMENGKHLPDVLFRFNGLRVVIECEVGTIPGTARKKAIESAHGRVEEGIADVGVALVYAPELAAQPTSAEVKKMMLSGDSVFEVAVI